MLIEVISAEIAPEAGKMTSQTLYPYEIGTTIRKKAATLTKNGLERRLWSDESARNAVIGKLG